MTRTVMLGAAALALAAIAGGCQLVEKSKYDELLQQNRQAAARVEHLKESIHELQTVVDDQKKQIATLQALGDKRLENLSYASSITLGRYTGGVDTDGEPGHDAIKVFLEPTDKEGSRIKAAGEVRIQLFDLAEPAGQNLIGEYSCPAEKLGEHWSSGFMTYHYSFTCPWKQGPPKHDEITVRVTFVDYLSGKTFTAQKLCRVALPAQQDSSGK